MYSLDDINRYVIKYQPDGLIIDTNILIFFLVGSYNPKFINQCKLIDNTKYCLSDFDLLKKITSYFKKLIITPHIIAEVSNLSRGNRGFSDDRLIDYFRVVINFLNKVEERHLELASLIGIDVELISKYGFTDMAMFELSKKTGIPILTDDTDFSAYSIKAIPIIKFEYIKYSI